MLMPNREQCLRRMAVRSCRGDRTEVRSKHKGHLLCRCPLHGTPDQTLTGGLPLRSEVEPMNRRVPQYPYTFYCEILTQNGL